VKYFAYVRTLTFSEEPKYEHAKKIIREELVRLNMQDRLLDWMEEKRK
jgi:hypothetical protein